MNNKNSNKNKPASQSKPGAGAGPKSTLVKAPAGLAPTILQGIFSVLENIKPGQEVKLSLSPGSKELAGLQLEVTPPLYEEKGEPGVLIASITNIMGNQVRAFILAERISNLLEKIDGNLGKEEIKAPDFQKMDSSATLNSPILTKLGIVEGVLTNEITLLSSIERRLMNLVE